MIMGHESRSHTRHGGCGCSLRWKKSRTEETFHCPGSQREVDKKLEMEFQLLILDIDIDIHYKKEHQLPLKLDFQGRLEIGAASRNIFVAVTSSQSHDFSCENTRFTVAGGGFKTVSSAVMRSSPSYSIHRTLVSIWIFVLLISSSSGFQIII